MRRIVVTGMGAASPLAAGVEASWSRLLAGRSGIRRLPDEVVANLPTKIGGVVPSIDEDPEARPRLAKLMMLRRCSRISHREASH